MNSYVSFILATLCNQTASRYLDVAVPLHFHERSAGQCWFSRCVMGNKKKVAFNSTTKQKSYAYQTTPASCTVKQPSLNHFTFPNFSAGNFRRTRLLRNRRTVLFCAVICVFLGSSSSASCGTTFLIIHLLRNSYFWCYYGQKMDSLFKWNATVQIFCSVIVKSLIKIKVIFSFTAIF